MNTVRIVVDRLPEGGESVRPSPFMNLRDRASKRGLAYDYLLGQIEGLKKELNKPVQDMNYVLEKLDYFCKQLDNILGSGKF